MKLLIVKLSAFGDIIHALPALDDLLKRPEVDQVHWLLDSRYAFIAPLLPKEVTLHVVQTRGKGKFTSVRRTISTLRALKFDIAIDLQGLIKSGFFARLCAKRAFGFDAALSPERGNERLVRPVRFHPDERHVVQQYRRIASAAYLPDSTQQPEHPCEYLPPRVTVTEEMRLRGGALIDRLGLRNRPYVILHLGGGWQTKQLPEATWQESARQLVTRGYLPLFSWGSETEQALANRVAEAVEGSLALPERLDIETLAGLIISAENIIGADTGVIHLAAALGASTISFWGPSDSQRSGPMGGNQYHVETHPPCGPCYKRTCNNFICLPSITPEMLLTHIGQG